MKLTRHNGRAGKNGAYNPKHNDRRFDMENSGHIDCEEMKVLELKDVVSDIQSFWRSRKSVADDTARN